VALPHSTRLHNMTVVDGPANPPDEALGVSILGPDFADWGIFYGTNTGDTQNVTANLIPSITNSDMRARWTSSGLTGTLQIQSCTRNCPFAPGQTLQITKEYGDGVYPPGDAPPPPTEGACAEDLCATDSALAQRCQSFLNTCLEQEADVNEDECLGGCFADLQKPALKTRQHLKGSLAPLWFVPAGFLMSAVGRLLALATARGMSIRHQPG
jgi:hypothetical protein